MDIIKLPREDGITAERVLFNGRVYYLYPELSHRSEGRYFSPSKGKRLHIAVWESHNGPVPEGYHVHHKNGCTTDNRIENLECLDRHEHLSGRSSEARTRASRENIKLAIEKARKWHSSPEGVEWHSRHGKAINAARENIDLVCEYCGEHFERRYRTKFCSSRCKNKSYYHKKSSRVERACVVCGKTRIVYRHSKTVCCSARCAAVLRWRAHSACV